MKMKKYIAYLDDGRDCFRVPVPAEDEEEVRRYVSGNGEVIAIRDVTEEFPITSKEVASALTQANFGKTEVSLIIRALEAVDICYPFC